MRGEGNLRSASNVKNLVEMQPAFPSSNRWRVGKRAGFSSSRATGCTIGRSDDNDIVVATEAVSRYHAVIERVPEGYWVIRDNQSKNGVQVNGIQIEEARLREGDVVQVGTLFSASTNRGDSRGFVEGEAGRGGAPDARLGGAPRTGKEKAQQKGRDLLRRRSGAFRCLVHQLGYARR